MISAKVIINQRSRRVKHVLLRDLGLMNHEKSKKGHDKQVIVWTRIFHVRPHSIGETCFLFVKKLFSFGKVGVPTYFIFILKGK